MPRLSTSEQKNVNEKFASFKQGKFTSDDTATVLNNIGEIFRKSEDGPLSKFFDDIKDMCALVKAWASREYKAPAKTIGMIILTLLYVISPVDLIPDFIPVIGLLDDATMVGLCLGAAKSEINEFRIWSQTHMSGSNL